MENPDVAKTALDFYKTLPFNYYGSIEEQVKSVLQLRPIEELYPPLKGIGRTLQKPLGNRLWTWLDDKLHC